MAQPSDWTTEKRILWYKENVHANDEWEKKTDTHIDMLKSGIAVILCTHRRHRLEFAYRHFVAYEMSTSLIRTANTHMFLVQVRERNRDDNKKNNKIFLGTNYSVRSAIRRFFYGRIQLRSISFSMFDFKSLSSNVDTIRLLRKRAFISSEFTGMNKR